jgi:hypothetical protein
MKCVMSWTDAPTSHHDLPFIPLHYTYAPHPSHRRHSLLPFPSLPFTSLHFTSLHFRWFPPHLHFAIFITFRTLFLKLLDLHDYMPFVNIFLLLIGTNHSVFVICFYKVCLKWTQNGKVVSLRITIWNYWSDFNVSRMRMYSYDTSCLMNVISGQYNSHL